MGFQPNMFATELNLSSTCTLACYTGTFGVYSKSQTILLVLKTIDRKFEC